jgi:cobalt/nickel transport system permease protein
MLFGVFIAFIMGMHSGETVLFSATPFGYTLSFKEEGLLRGLLIFSKILGGVMLLLLLSFTTSITKICVAARWMKIPEIFIEVLSFIYRYIFLLMEETETMMSSQKSRLGYSTWFRTIRSFGSLGGMLIIRSITRAENAHAAMISRGYDGGRIFSLQLTPFRRYDYVMLFSSALFLTPLFTIIFLSH